LRRSTLGLDLEENASRKERRSWTSGERGFRDAYLRTLSAVNGIERGIRRLRWSQGRKLPRRDNGSLREVG